MLSKFSILHISDIHIVKGENSILEKVESISKAIKSELIEFNNLLFIVISGDVAFSGQEEEYTIASEFLEELRKDIKRIFPLIDVHFIISPGNHDCDFENEEVNLIRNLIIEKIQNNPSEEIDQAYITNCCQVQHNFKEFSSLYDKNLEVADNDLLRTIKYKFSNKEILFQVFNTSWISSKSEPAGKNIFPYYKYQSILENNNADFVISVLHHPIHWLHPDNARKVSNLVEETSDLVFTGHEHESTFGIKDNLEGKLTEYIEGGVLQDNNDSKKSEFNLILIDMNKSKHRLYKYKWNKSYYIIDKESGWIEANKTNYNKKVQINSTFLKKLNDPGANYLHPRKDNLTLNDIFIYPDLRKIEMKGKYSKKNTERRFNSKKIIENIENNKIYLIMGEEKAGKTALCKVIFKYFFYQKKNYFPIIIDGQEVNNSDLKSFEKIVFKNYLNQYSEETYEVFQQTDNINKIIIIDDFDKAKLNNKYKYRLLEKIKSYYPNIIITGNDLFKLTEFIGKEEIEETLINIEQYEIIEFGHNLREEMINNWNSIGNIEFVEEKELIEKNDKYQRKIDTVLGKNFVPSIPFFLMLIIQSIESGGSTKESTYGYYYDLLINQALVKNNLKNEEIDVFNNYLTELAFYFYEHRITDISEQDLKDNFHEWFIKEYDLEDTKFDDFSILKNKLITSSLIDEVNQIYKFKYKYIYYYYASKYFANNINEAYIRQQITLLSRKLYIEEYSNIIMFLTHMSKNPFILNTVYETANFIFNEFEPSELYRDIPVLNSLIEKIPNLVLENHDIRENRKKRLKRIDEIEAAEREIASSKEELSIDSENEIDIIGKINLAYKTMEVIGQILKNYYGSIKKDDKYLLISEVYNVGLRTLNYMLSFFESNITEIVSDISTIIKEDGVVEENQKEQYARKLIFYFTNMLAFQIIKKISGAVGNENLMGTFKKILRDNNFPSVSLIDISIKLDNYRSIPNSDLKKLKDNFEGKIFAYEILRKLLYNHLYMFPVNEKDKQRIAELFDISINEIRLIEHKMNHL